MAPSVSAAAFAAARAPVIQVAFEMNEPVGATLMVDSTGSGLSGLIDQAGLDTGAQFDSATGYHWPWRSPTAPPASPERIIQVADSPLLDPGTDTFTVEIRYRTKEKFGNIIQKGQATSAGGQWKIENPAGKPTCLFKGSIRRVATTSKIAFNDNRWHVLQCVHEPNRTSMFVDGVLINHQTGSTGTIDNALPMTIGGKLYCDNIKVTCDYFSGMIDYVRITRGV